MYGWFHTYCVVPFHEGVVRGRPTVSYYRRLMRSQWHTARELRRMQRDGLQKLLRHAACNVPYYRERYRRFVEDEAVVGSISEFQQLPMLSKDDLRRHQRDLMADGVDPASLYVSHSGGSTGQPVEFRYDKDSLAWRTAGWWRADSMAGWSLGAKTMMFSLGVGAGRQRQRGLEWLKERIHWKLKRWHIITCSTFTRKDLQRYAKAMHRYRPDVLFGYPDALAVFARFIEEDGTEVPPLRGIILGGEKVFESQKEVIAKAFQCPVHERYGSQEVCNIAMECEAHDGMHINAENVYVEVVDDAGRPVPPGEVGEVLVTTLTNFAMPLIRYRLGDMAMLDDTPCPCGRGLPKIREVVGRTVDVIVTPDGRYCSGVIFPHVMKEFPEVLEFQVYQPEVETVIVRVVPSPAFTAGSSADIERALRQYLGDVVRVAVEPVQKLERTAGGKYRLTVSDVLSRRAEAASKT